MQSQILGINIITPKQNSIDGIQVVNSFFEECV